MIAGNLETTFSANLDQLRAGMALAEKELRAFEKRAAAVVNIGARGGSSRLPGGRNVIQPALDQKIIYNNAAAMQAQLAATTQLVAAISRLTGALGPLQAAMARVGTTTQNVSRVTNNYANTYNRLPQQIQRVSQAHRGLIGSTTSLRGAVVSLAAAYGTLQGAQGFKGIIDTSNRMTNALKVVGLEGQELVDTYDRLFEAAQKNYTPVETLVTLYSRLGLAQSELGKSNEEIEQFTGRIAQLLRLQGTTATEARGALIQLTQAMGAGIVRAEEYNSIVEGAPSILRAAARGLTEAGGSVAKLRTLVIDGKLSSQSFFDAIIAGSRDTERQLSYLPPTIDQSITHFNNEMIESVGQMDKMIGVTGRTVSAINNLTNAMKALVGWVEENQTQINAFLDYLGDGSRWQGLANNFAMVQQAIRDFGVATGANQIGEAIKRSFDEGSAAAEELQGKIDQATHNLVDFGNAMAAQSNTIDPALIDYFNDVILKLVDGKISAEEAREEINMLARMDGTGGFDVLRGEINGLISVFDALTLAATQAKAAVGFENIKGWGQGIMDSLPGIWDALQQAAQGPIQTIDNTEPPGKPKKGRSAKTPRQQYDEELARMRDRILLIEQETASVGMLNSVQETYRVKQELINAAREKGITLAPEDIDNIEAIAQAYGNATQALDDANAALEMQMDLYGEFGSAIGDALGALISGSEDAERALAKMVLQMLQAVIQAQILNSIGKTNPALGGAFGNIISGVFGGFRAEGGPVSAGTPYVVGEKGPELMVPGSNGYVVPNRQAFGPASRGGGQINVVASMAVENGNLVPLITEVSGEVAGQRIQQSERTQGQRNMMGRLNRVPGMRN